jgi:hypothetical protein
MRAVIFFKEEGSPHINRGLTACLSKARQTAARWRPKTRGGMAGGGVAGAHPPAAPSLHSLLLHCCCRFIDQVLQLSNLPALTGYLFGGNSAGNVLARWDGDVVAGTFDELTKQVWLVSKWGCLGRFGRDAEGGHR